MCNHTVLPVDGCSASAQCTESPSPSGSGSGGRPAQGRSGRSASPCDRSRLPACSEGRSLRPDRSHAVIADGGQALGPPLLPRTSISVAAPSPEHGSPPCALQALPASQSPQSTLPAPLRTAFAACDAPGSLCSPDPRPPPLQRASKSPSRLAQRPAASAPAPRALEDQAEAGQAASPPTGGSQGPASSGMARKYTREELLALRDSPGCRSLPPGLDSDDLR